MSVKILKPGVVPAQDQIFIKQLSDFTNPLVDGKTYTICRDLDFANGDELVLPTGGSCNIISATFNQTINMTYSGTSDFITGTNANPSKNIKRENCNFLILF